MGGSVALALNSVKETPSHWSLVWQTCHQSAKQLAPWGGGSVICAPPPPRCARRVTSYHPGCNHERVPALSHARITQRELEPDFDPRTKIPTGPGETCRYFGSCGRTQILARRKGVLGVVLRALYGDGASHTRFQCSEILGFFWPKK